MSDTFGSVCELLGIENRASQMLGKCSIMIYTLSPTILTLKVRKIRLRDVNNLPKVVQLASGYAGI